MRKKLFFLLVLLLASSVTAFGQTEPDPGSISPWRYNGTQTNEIYFNNTTGWNFVGINTNNPNCALDFGTQRYGTKMISFYGSGSSTNWYGFGLSPGKLRIQTNASGKIGFFAGSSEIAELHNNGGMIFQGNAPSLILNNQASTPGQIHFSYRLNNVAKADLIYDPGPDHLIFRHGGSNVMTLDKNQSDYWVTVRRGLQAWKLKTDASLADYVFADDYTYPSLLEVESFIEEHRHLPGVISAAEVEAAGGVELGEFTVQLQEKLEELYLHSIAQEKRIQALEAELQTLKQD